VDRLKFDQSRAGNINEAKAKLMVEFAFYSELNFETPDRVANNPAALWKWTRFD